MPVPLAKDVGLLLDPNFHLDRILLRRPPHVCQVWGRLTGQRCLGQRLITIIQSLVFSKMNYCSIVWSTPVQVIFVNYRQYRQNFSVRIITNSRKFDHLTPLLHNVRCMNGMAPDYLTKQFINRGSISRRCTRNSQSLDIPLYKSATGQERFVTVLFHSGTIYQ